GVYFSSSSVYLLGCVVQGNGQVCHRFAGLAESKQSSLEEVHLILKSSLVRLLLDPVLANERRRYQSHVAQGPLLVEKLESILKLNAIVSLHVMTRDHQHLADVANVSVIDADVLGGCRRRMASRLRDQVGDAAIGVGPPEHGGLHLLRFCAVC